eukprot:scaffold152390_cov19-Tisochrysis_lutea.AAC.2
MLFGQSSGLQDPGSQQCSNGLHTQGMHHEINEPSMQIQFAKSQGLQDANLMETVQHTDLWQAIQVAAVFAPRSNI